MIHKYEHLCLIVTIQSSWLFTRSPLGCIHDFSHPFLFLLPGKSWIDKKILVEFLFLSHSILYSHWNSTIIWSILRAVPEKPLLFSLKNNNKTYDHSTADFSYSTKISIKGMPFGKRWWKPACQLRHFLPTFSSDNFWNISFLNKFCRKFSWVQSCNSFPHVGWPLALVFLGTFSIFYKRRKSCFNGKTPMIYIIMGRRVLNKREKDLIVPWRKQMCLKRYCLHLGKQWCGNIWNV